MGWISNRAMSRGHGLNANPKNNGSKNGPLRKIVCHVAHPMIPEGRYSKATVQVLECGHWINHANDLFGSRFPEKRRCTKCRDGKSPKWNQEQILEWEKQVKDRK